MRKRFCSYLLLVGLMLTGTVMWSCSDDNDDNGGNIDDKPISATLDEAQISSTSVVINLETTDVSKYVYVVKEGSVSSLPDGEELFLSADANNIVECKGNSEKLAVVGLEGNKDYTILFSFKREKADKTVEYIVKSVTVKTANYDKLLTVLSTSMFGVKFHIECPADKYYRYALVNKFIYESRNEMFEGTGMDLTFLAYGALIGKGPKTIEWNDGEPLDPDDDEMGTMSVKPGTAYYLLVAECDADGEMDFEVNGGGGDDWDLLSPAPSSRALPDLVGECLDQPVDEGVTFNGFFARQELYSEFPAVGYGSVDFETVIRTEHTLGFEVAPHGDVQEYLVSILADVEYDILKRMVGEKGMQAAVLTGDIPVVYQGTEANTVSVSGLEKDSKYHFFVTGICDTEGKVQTFNEYTVSTIKSDKAIPEIAITGISAPEGSAEAGPYYVWFNIKAPNKDCVRLKYLCNTKAQWVIAGNEGKGDETMFNSYGQELKDADIIQAINSDAGFNINFGSWENTVSILKIASYNEEEALKVFSGESTSPEEQDKARIESHLFNTLQGDYTTTVTITEGGYIGQPDTEHDVDIRMNISSNPFTDSPANYSAFKATQEYTNLLNYFKTLESTEEAAEARLKGVFDEYKEFEAKYVQKYRGQNRLVITDFNVFNNSMTQYLSPWKLFCEIEGYNSFGTADLFYDYGPKMFIEMLGENDAIVPTNTQFIPPVLSWGGNNYVYYLGAQLEGKENGQKVLFDVEFPLNITENETTLEIPGISKDGEMYYPSLISSFGMSAYCTSKPWVLKKGWNGGSAKASMPYTRSGMKASYRNGSHFKTTYLPIHKKGLKNVEVKYISLKEYAKQAKK